jgi:uncharacterized protein DUF421
MPTRGGRTSFPPRHRVWHSLLLAGGRSPSGCTVCNRCSAAGRQIDPTWMMRSDETGSKACPEDRKLEEEARRQQVASLSEIRWAILEKEGSISVIKKP